MVVISDIFHHCCLNWKLPLGNCFILVTSLSLLEQVEETLFIMCKITACCMDDMGTTVKGKDLQVLMGETTKAELPVTLTMTLGSKSQIDANRDVSVQPLSNEQLLRS